VQAFYPGSQILKSGIAVGRNLSARSISPDIGKVKAADDTIQPAVYMILHV
jgi:hypothetical protein